MGVPSWQALSAVEQCLTEKNVPTTRSVPDELAALGFSGSRRRPHPRGWEQEDRGLLAAFRAQSRNSGWSRKKEAGLSQTGEMLRAGPRALKRDHFPSDPDNALELFLPKTWVRKLAIHSQSPDSSVWSSRQVCRPILGVHVLGGG